MGSLCEQICNILWISTPRSFVYAKSVVYQWDSMHSLNTLEIVKTFQMILKLLKIRSLNSGHSGHLLIFPKDVSVIERLL
jgi:hypothetical protein